MSEIGKKLSLGDFKNIPVKSIPIAEVAQEVTRPKGGRKAKEDRSTLANQRIPFLLTEAQKEKLIQSANGIPLGTFIKSVLIKEGLI